MVGALYTGRLVVPAGADPAAAAQAGESLGGAVEAAHGLPETLAGPLLASARGAFVHGVNVAAILAGVLLLGAAVLSWRLLRGLPGAAPAPAPEQDRPEDRKERTLEETGVR